MTLITGLVNSVIEFMKHDPVLHCSLYKDLGCAHVDGFLCDYPECTMNKEYERNRRII